MNFPQCLVLALFFMGVFGYLVGLGTGAALAFAYLASRPKRDPLDIRRYRDTGIRASNGKAVRD